MKGSRFESACDFARELTGVSATNTELVEEIPAIDALLYGAALSIQGELTQEIESCLGGIFTNLMSLAEQAAAGDSVSMAALKAIDAVATPNLLNISPQTLENLAGRTYKSWLARASILIDLMGDLSWVVEPVKSHAKTMRTGAVRPMAILTQKIKRTARLNTDEKLETLHALATQHCRHNTTLQALAIKVFNIIAEREGHETQDERVLKRDLQKLKKWVAEHPSEATMCGWLSLRGEEDVLYE